MYYLTPRQTEVARLIHLSNEQIAARLGISRNTVNDHATAVKSFFTADTRAEAALIFHGILPRKDS